MKDENQNTAIPSSESQATPELSAAPTWDALLATPVGSVFVDKFDEGLRLVILRGPAAVCAYVGVPLAHPLAGHPYDDLTVECHGGLTYGSEGTGKYLPENFYWYGWDYGHLGDASAFADQRARAIGGDRDDETKWLPAEVERESWSALYDFKRLMRLAERIAAKAQDTNTAEAAGTA